MDIFFKLVSLSNKAKDFFRGKKTYLVGIAAICGALIAWSNGQAETQQTIHLIIDAVIGMTIRAGVAKK